MNREPPRRDGNRRMISATCTVHGGSAGYPNLVVRKLLDGSIEFDPHVTGACVIVLDEAAATQLFDAFGEWLR